MSGSLPASAPPAIAPPPPSRRAKLALVLLSSALALGAAELALRLSGASNPNFYQPDPVRGWGLIPRAEGWWTSEGRAYVRINGDGERDVEHTAAKPAGVLRVAVLGDSCTEALQVPVDRTFWKLMEAELGGGHCAASAGCRAVEVLNFGVAGYGTAQELLTLREKVWKYAPDAVVLAFYTGNDVRNNFRRLEQDPARPYFVLRPRPGRPAGVEELLLDDSFRTTWGYRLRRTPPAELLYGIFNHSRLLGLAKRGKGVVDGWIGTAKARTKETGEALQELGLDNAVYAPPHDPDWRQAWQATEAMIAAMRDEAAAHGAAFGVLSLTTPMQIHPEPAVRRAFMRKLGVADLFYPDRRLASFGAAHGIPVLALAPPLQELAEREHVYFHGFPNTAPGEGHWNERGHAAAAPRAAAWICRTLLSQPSSGGPRDAGARRSCWPRSVGAE